MPKYALAPVFEIKPEFFEAFVARLRTHRDNCLRLEEGCLTFDVMTSEEKPNHVLLFETYRDRDALELHRNTEHFKIYREETQHMIVSRDVVIWEVAE